MPSTPQQRFDKFVKNHNKIACFIVIVALPLGLSIALWQDGLKETLRQLKTLPNDLKREWCRK